ncbi:MULTISPECIES: hypothetical protein [Paenibacillus]|uniref:DUF559 domain-containing protein n=2 Tax=Paenibacillus lactis TaxID=228574 RepID=G4HGB5_9BACL|nr:hypothetical protein [Paenibacillus lactis]EHB64126.1 hypothetical protein PaelaDRAFT_3240 [Paenibacillus lactis 154]MBP1895223.1 hypothetical protein [Paenibacillus lactis]MCM3497677.1 hypothetical protein [Paenibacillus lactis]GIO94036.1 hypothetical protein J31TS3_52630 [Paenibacillus lactis]HAF97706.1 hypothetical protein [Paenibacillus lactis]
MISFEDRFNLFLKEQKSTTDKRRLEMLNRDMTGTKLLIKNVVLPVLGTLQGVDLEYRIKNSAGVSLFIDVFYTPLRLGLECEGFAAHAETITRERFSFERSKIRTMAALGISYLPFSMDDIEKRPETCRNSLADILDYYSHTMPKIAELSLYEREAMRYFSTLHTPFALADVRRHFKISRNKSIKIMHSLLAKGLIKPLNPNAKRYHRYTLADDATHYMK